jgi:hypothetical protein
LLSSSDVVVFCVVIDDARFKVGALSPTSTVKVL